MTQRHTHILASIGRCNEECRHIIGHVLHHDDSLTDRSEGSNLDVAFKATKKLWREAYGSDYVVEGGMFRGDPPIAYFAQNFFDGDKAYFALHPLSGPYQSLVGKVGASSTIPKEDEVIPTVVATAVAPSAPPLPPPSAPPLPPPSETPPATSIKTTTIENRPDGSTVTTVRTTNADGSSTTTVTTTPPATMSNSPVVVAGSPVSGWLNASGTATDGNPAFIAAAVPSAADLSPTRGVRANPRRNGYVFGSGALGVGYYHMETKGASELMHKRLLLAQEKKRSQVRIIHNRQSCCFCFASLFEEEKKKLEVEFNEVNDMVAVAKARSEAQIPLGAVGMSANNPRYKDFYGNDGRWQNPQYYIEAAACGAAPRRSEGHVLDCAACSGCAACGGGGKIICLLNAR